MRFLFQELGKALSDYKDIAIEQDEDYQKYRMVSQSANQDLLEDFPIAIDDLLHPSELTTSLPHKKQKQKFRLSSLGLANLRKLLTTQPVFATESWKWALFERKRLAQAVRDFRHYNKQLRDFEPQFIASTLFTRQDLIDLVNVIQNEPDADAAAFVPHARIRQLASAEESKDQSIGFIFHQEV